MRILNPLKLAGLVYLTTLAMIVLPAVLAILTFWWVAAWILGQVFPGRDYFPLGRICSTLVRFLTSCLK